MLTSERFPRANDDWEDRAKSDKTWASWKLAYTQAHAKARVKAQVTNGSIKIRGGQFNRLPRSSSPS